MLVHTGINQNGTYDIPLHCSVNCLGTCAWNDVRATYATCGPHTGADAQIGIARERPTLWQRSLRCPLEQPHA